LKRKLLAACIALIVGALLFVAVASGRSYRAACVAAERYVEVSDDGPWVRSKVRLVVDLDWSGSPVEPALLWIFRFRNPRSGNESRRIYTTFSGDRAFAYKVGVLDPVPLLGSRP
jgi:hypothetical protein